MTLDTRIYVTAPIDAHDLFHACRLALSLYDELQRGPDQQKWSDEAATYYPGRLLSNKCGQGLPGRLMLHYRETGMYRKAEHEPPCWVEISIDTAYSYRDQQGRGCGALHAELVDLIGSWLDARGVTWRWLNEFTGEVFDGRDGLDTLGRSGEAARQWFARSALPAILAHMQGGES